MIKFFKVRWINVTFTRAFQIFMNIYSKNKMKRKDEGLMHWEYLTSSWLWNLKECENMFTLLYSKKDIQNKNEWYLLLFQYIIFIINISPSLQSLVNIKFKSENEITLKALIFFITNITFIWVY